MIDANIIVWFYIIECHRQCLILVCNGRYRHRQVFGPLMASNTCKMSIFHSSIQYAGIMNKEKFWEISCSIACLPRITENHSKRGLNSNRFELICIQIIGSGTHNVDTRGSKIHPRRIKIEGWKNAYYHPIIYIL